MRSRPVVPIVGRRVMEPWRLGPYAVQAETPILVSILLLHHREDLYEDPFEFRPERWDDRKPGTYEWLPFGGGIRRCLGAALAMAEQRVVLEAMARRLDLEAADPEPERALHRNVTMIPRHGARVVIRSRAAWGGSAAGGRAVFPGPGDSEPLHDRRVVFEQAVDQGRRVGVGEALLRQPLHQGALGRRFVRRFDRRPVGGCLLAAEGGVQQRRGDQLGDD